MATDVFNKQNHTNSDGWVAITLALKAAACIAEWNDCKFGCYGSRVEGDLKIDVAFVDLSLDGVPSFFGTQIRSHKEIVLEAVYKPEGFTLEVWRQGPWMIEFHELFVKGA